MVADFGKKRNRKFFNSSFLFQVGVFFFLAVVVVLVYVNLKMYWRRKELISQLEFYKNQIEEIKKSSQVLEVQIANSDNPDYLEEIAYEQLGEQKPGEQAVIFVTPEEKSEESPKPESFWTSWFMGAWNWIKNKF